MSQVFRNKSMWYMTHYFDDENTLCSSNRAMFIEQRVGWQGKGKFFNVSVGDGRREDNLSFTPAQMHALYDLLTALVQDHPL